MKGEPKVIETLNRGLTVELTAINQYFVQAKMCANWGFGALGKKHYDESIGEMRHADAIIERILFLEGTPAIGRYNPIRVGATVPEQLENDLKLETDGVKLYNEAIRVAIDANDNGSRELFEKILVQSEEHVDWLETQLNVIKNIGLDNYLSEQLGGGGKS
jgi:bacterioferritin